jgi:hypothetical protein
MYWKDLTKKEKKHLKEQEIATLRDFKSLAEKQKDMRLRNSDIEPCWDCKSIARKLGLPI